MSDLFGGLEQEQIRRLQELGWKQVENFGHTYWEHPVSHSWHSLAQALEWLAKEDSLQ